MEIDFNAPEVKQAIEAKAGEIAAGLKAKNTELMDELKGFKSKFDGFDPDEYKSLKEKARDMEDKGIKDAKEFRARIEAEFTPKLTKLEEELKAERIARREDTIERTLTEALVAANVSKELLPAAKALLRTSRKVDVTDGGATVDGSPVSEFVQKWAAAEGKAFIAAANNSGGGSNGSNAAGGANGQKASKMSQAEKIAFIKEHGQEAWVELIKKG